MTYSKGCPIPSDPNQSPTPRWEIKAMPQYRIIFPKKNKSNAQKCRFRKQSYSLPRGYKPERQKGAGKRLWLRASVASGASIAHVDVHHLALSRALFAADDHAFL